VAVSERGRPPFMPETLSSALGGSHLAPVRGLECSEDRGLWIAFRLIHSFDGDTSGAGRVGGRNDPPLFRSRFLGTGVIGVA